MRVFFQFVKNKMESGPGIILVRVNSPVINGDLVKFKSRNGDSLASPMQEVEAIGRQSIIKNRKRDYMKSKLISG